VTFTYSGIPQYRYISIHTFLTEGDKIATITITPENIFQSTPSSQKVTIDHIEYDAFGCISIHTFLTEGDMDSAALPALWNISIHTFLTEGDSCRFNGIFVPLLFQSTPSSQKVTSLSVYQFSSQTDFNPHLPHRR